MSNSVSLFIVGTEITRGVIADLHTQFICNQLKDLGYSVLRSIIVPDDGSIQKMLHTCVMDSDVVLITGGLGPTADDMTRTIIATEAHTTLVKNQDAWDALYKRVGDRIWGANEKQAYIPDGFEVLPNTLGTACGFYGFVKHDDKQTLLMCMPGPPREMQPMFFDQVMPLLSKLKDGQELKREEFSIYLIAESHLQEICSEHQKEGVVFGDRFQNYKISLYLSGGEDSEREKMEAELKARLGALMVDGNVEASDALADYLKQNHYTISTAESCTSGYLGMLLTEKAGSSAYYLGGVNSYSENAKENLIDVPKNIINTYSVYSHECAKAMAEGIRNKLDTDFSISITGVAGPEGGTEDNPVGTVYFGFASKTRPTATVRLQYSVIRRDFIRKRSVVAACVLGLLYAKGEDVVKQASLWKDI